MAYFNKNRFFVDYFQCEKKSITHKERGLLIALWVDFIHSKVVQRKLSCTSLLPDMFDLLIRKRARRYLS